jgi:hypothetical protein
LEGDARREFDELARSRFAAVPFDSEWLFQLSLLTQVCVALGDTQNAALLYELMLPYADSNVLVYPELSLGSASHYLGILASALSRWADAERHFEAAIEMNTRMDALPWVSHTEHDYAAMLVARGQPDDGRRASELVERALAGYRELGIGPRRGTIDA